MPPATRKRLYLVDGMSQLYRAYYAIRGLSTSTGIPTNAVYGFTMMLRRLINEEKPDYLGVAWDVSGPTFRHDSYSAYKATRSGMPEDLSVQVAYVNKLCEALRVPMAREKGFEADDIIGTLAAQAENAGVDCIIVTNDKDMCQLVTDHVKILRTSRDGTLTIMDAKAVETKMGVRPDQVVDLLALWGDTSDNIPGAPGVGEKGAQQIIQQFQTLDNALAHAGEISRKTYRESLTNNVDLIRQSRELVTIKCDMPITLDLESLIYESADRLAAYELFSELEFANLKKEYADAASQESVIEAQRRLSITEYTRITTKQALDEFMNELWAADAIAVSVAEREGELSAISISTGPGKAALIDLDGFEAGVDPIAALKEVFENGLIRKSLQDWKSALTLLDRYVRTRSGDRRENGTEGSLERFEPAIRIEGVEDDTLLASYLLDPNRATYRILEIARERLGLEMSEAADGFEEGDLRALQTADLTLQLAGELRERIEEAGLEVVYHQIELPLVEILFEMERTGVRIDIATLHESELVMEKELERLTASIFEQAGQPFNINSTIQLGEIFEKLNFGAGKKTKTGRISTSVEVLEELATKYELPRLIIEYRELSKLKSTYVDALPKLIDPRSGRIHTTLNQAVSATGRLSSTNPNLQNIPIRSEQGRRIRAAFVASPGHVLMSADYSQIELRLFAHITGDPVMTEAFKNNEDIHAKTAREVFGAKTKEEHAVARRLAKIVNFAIPYVIGPFGLSQRTGLSRADAKKVIADYYETYKEVRRYMEETPEQVRQTGIVRTIFGRIRPIPDINNRNHNLRARAEREAINAPIQGSAADLVKIAMIRVDERLKREGLGGRIILQVHDELLLEVPEEEAEQTGEVVKTEMESVYPLAVPLIVDVGVGHNWVEAKP